MRRSPLAIVLLSATAALSSACDDTTTTTTTTTGSVFPTSIGIEPSYFLGDVPCTNAAGGMRSYVATLRDVTDPLSTPFDLPSSPPVSCTGMVTFRQVLENHTYRTEIDGYDVDASQLLPLGGFSSGSRIMVRKDAPLGAHVEPRWSTWCNDVLASLDIRQIPTECEPLVKTPSSTGILVDPESTLLGSSSGSNSGLVCRALDMNGDPTGPGDVASFDVLPEDPALPALVNVGCGPTAAKPLPYEQGITPGKEYSFRVEAHGEAGGPTVWGASCSAIAADGLVISAVCDPLSANGSAQVSLAGLLDLAGLVCGDASVSTYDVALVGPTSLSAAGVPCEKPVVFSPLKPGSYVATVVGKGLGQPGDVKVSGTCSATVIPGAVSVANCKLL